MAPDSETAVIVEISGTSKSPLLKSNVCVPSPVSMCPGSHRRQHLALALGTEPLPPRVSELSSRAHILVWGGPHRPRSYPWSRWVAGLWSELVRAPLVNMCPHGGACGPQAQPYPQSLALTRALSCLSEWTPIQGKVPPGPSSWECGQCELFQVSGGRQGIVWDGCSQAGCHLCNHIHTITP